MQGIATNDAELVLAFLREAEGDPVPAEALAGKLGLQPAALFHAVRDLQAQGYEIDSLAKQGYRLIAEPDPLDAPTLSALLSTRELGWALHHHSTLPSTNDEAVILARAGAAQGEVVLADRQTAGRGRRGRSWLSPPKVNIHLSLILRPQLSPQRAPELVSLVAVAAAETLREVGVPAQIKWPNDLMVDGRKLAGILLDLSAEADRIHYVVVGVGINLNSTLDDFPEELRPLISSVRLETGAPLPRAPVIASFLAILEGWLDRFGAEGFTPIRSRYRELSSILGKPVRMSEADRSLEGIAEEIDEVGALLIRKSDGSIERFLSGDITSLRVSG